MTRRTKPRDESQQESAQALEDGLATLTKQLLLLNKMTTSLEKMVEDSDDGKYRKHDPKLVQSLATIARSATGVAAEIRKLEAHHKRRVEELDPKERDALVKNYIMELPIERRKELLAGVSKPIQSVLGGKHG